MQAAAKVNVPLKDSENERARGLVNLDAKFVVDVATMSPKASSYFRTRPYLTPEVCRRWRMGYLPRDTGGEDKSGGTMRGKIVYAYCQRSRRSAHLVRPGSGVRGQASEVGCRRPNREGTGEVPFRERASIAASSFSASTALRELGRPEQIRKLGLILVEGPNDVIRLDTLGVPAVALCSNTITREQAVKAATLAQELAGGIVTVFLDCDQEGLNGMKQCLGYLAQLTPVRLAWTDRMFGGKFKGKQPESLTIQDWQEMCTFLQEGTMEGWQWA